MRKLILLFAFVCCTMIINAQKKYELNDAKEVEYVRIIDFKNKVDPVQFQNCLLDYAVTHKNLFNQGNMRGGGNGLFKQVESLKLNEIITNKNLDNPIVLDDKGRNKIILKALYKTPGTRLGCTRIILMNYSITVDIKPEKFRISIGGFNYEQYNWTNYEPWPFWATKSETCGATGTLENLLECKKCKKSIYEYHMQLIDFIEAQLKELSTGFSSCESAKDDW